MILFVDKDTTLFRSSSICYRGWLYLDDGTADGCFVDDRCFGSYIHGLLDNETVVSYLISPYLKEKRNEKFDYTAYKEEQYDLLADHLRKHIDIDKLYKIMKHHD